MSTNLAAAAQLTPAQHREIYDNGFVLLPGVVPAPMVKAAMRAINASLGDEGMNKPDLPRMRAQSYCPELREAPCIVDLFNATSAIALAESALAPAPAPAPGVLHRPDSGQIALRFPTMNDEPMPPGAHLDGMSAPLNGVKAGTIAHFTMLAAVFLSDVPEPDSGNFTVWPGTHRLFESYFRKHGPQSLLDGMPRVEMPPPHQILARAGDVALVHYQVGHTAAVNRSAHIRYAVFFRLTHIDHAHFGWDVMTDIWAEWAGVRESVRPE